MIKVITGINNKIMIHATCTQVLNVKMALSNKSKKVIALRNVCCQLRKKFYEEQFHSRCLAA